MLSNNSVQHSSDPIPAGIHVLAYAGFSSRHSHGNLAARALLMTRSHTGTQVVPCPYTYRHNWTHCPFAHSGETARRRDPTACAHAAELCPRVRSVSPRHLSRCLCVQALDVVPLYILLACLQRRLTCCRVLCTTVNLPASLAQVNHDAPKAWWLVLLATCMSKRRSGPTHSYVNQDLTATAVSGSACTTACMYDT